MTLEDLKKKYVFSNDNVDSLQMAYEERMNIVNFGLGGFSKSVLVDDFFTNVVQEPYFLLTCGKGLTVDKLFGGINVTDLTTKGEMNYLIENSFMMHKNVVFEELFDSPPEVIEMLKQTLSSGVFSNGNQSFKIKTEFIVANTNRTREEFSKGNKSVDALLERFPLAQEYKWEKYTKETYGKLLETRLGVDYCDPIYLEILEEIAVDKKIISPRIALVGAKIVKNRGLDNLKFVSDFKVKQAIVDKVKIKYVFRQKIQEIKDAANVAAAQQKKASSSDVQEFKRIEQVFRDLVFKANSLPQSDESVKEITDLITSLNAKVNTITKHIELNESLASSIEELDSF